MRSWGIELVVDCRGCDPEFVRSADKITEFVKDLVRQIDMKAFGEPWLHRFAEHDDKKVGYTLFQPIETSSITAHFVEYDNSAYINIHSCKEFREEDALSVIHSWMNPAETTTCMLERGLDYGEDPVLD